MSDTLKPVEKLFNSSIRKYIENDAVRYLVGVLGILSYVYRIKEFPDEFKDILLMPTTQFVLTFLSIFFINRDFTSAIIATILLTGVTSYLLTVKEEFTELEVMPGCETATKADLLELFEGDEEKLLNYIKILGVPYNVELSDENAPFIATYFVNANKEVSNTCALPKKC